MATSRPSIEMISCSARFIMIIAGVLPRDRGPIVVQDFSPADALIVVQDFSPADALQCVNP
jgi:hypothetical protein